MGLFGKLAGGFGGLAKKAGKGAWNMAKENAGDLIQQGVGSFFGGGEQAAAPAPEAAPSAAHPLAAVGNGQEHPDKALGGDAGGGLAAMLSSMGFGLPPGLASILGGMLG